MKRTLLIILILTSSLGFAQTKFDTKSFGQKILNGQVKYDAENEMNLMRTLDSLFCKVQSDKSFYFKVANKIFQFSDGALSEHCSGIASKYYLERNREFVNNSLPLYATALNKWFEFAAFDIAADAQDISKLPKIKKQLDDLIANCKCNSAKQAIIKKHNAILYRKIEFNLKNP